MLSLPKPYNLLHNMDSNILEDKFIFYFLAYFSTIVSKTLPNVKNL